MENKKPEVIIFDRTSAMSYLMCVDIIGDSNWLHIDEMPNGRINGLPGLKTPDGIVEVENGDYIIKYPNGDLYACKPNLFNMEKEEYISVTY